MKTNGQIAYEAYCSAGRMIAEPWELKDRFEREMWELSAKAVLDANQCQDEEAPIYLSKEQMQKLQHEKNCAMRTMMDKLSDE